jgi:hypothetical protein
MVVLVGKSVGALTEFGVDHGFKFCCKLKREALAIYRM